MSDFKYEMQCRAEELADEDGKDYFKLSQDEQHRYYETAMQDWYDRQAAAAERLEDR